MARGDDYRFLRVVDAFSSVNQRVNLIGVIIDYGIPKPTKGTDWFCSMRVVDESHNSRGLSVNFFAETNEKLPLVESSGDIIQLSNVVIKVHHKEIYALFNKKFSSFALYEGKNGETFTPYQSSLRFHPGEQDKTHINGLRKWLDSFQLDTASRDSVSLREIKKGGRADLICKILQVYEVTTDEWMVFVWDGTDAPRLQIQANLGDEKENPLTLQMESHPLPRDILCKFPTVGTILRIRVREGIEKLSLPSLVCRWARFINLTFEVQAGFWYGVFIPCTKIRFVPNEDPLVLKRQRDFEERVSSKWDRMPNTSFPWPSHITETVSEDVPFVTLLDIITYSKVTAKFKCVVRVVAALPWMAEDFRSPSGTYRIRLTLEDPTSRIHAFVYAEDGITLFDGHPSIRDMKRKRNKLLGIPESDDGNESGDSPRDPPWVQCCIKSYYADRSRMWESREYRIFGTRLIC
ncbi:hypothetical protein Nepgr_025213 [Nepenthes gracilis]|uniref:Telomeric single stranded DNA binding POT1/Cdc13 domain-containing protein n=1 Tax=Nepenthes gracilis TaxID=150966 RepID=A0AAD3Y0V0_NEPGR|nr:hypothetical protein Nepgr_025213 [Nepenthes gracilis]